MGSQESFRDHFYISNLVSCPVPKRFHSSSELYISISNSSCRAQRVAMPVRIDRTKRKKEAVAVCVKGMDFQIPLTLPGHSPNLPLVRSEYIARNRQQKRRHELIPYNDCLYR
ncbi:hypothetical protein OESDEN_24015 [Oesophagostomum dentatum]|uniref:Uncharacterized protein n=1 Tax=Oesophagostomum dentatum TaxID=61180 RepID=A0A0B1RZH0_OESDE|nr:hypothetical protein OESDEN_24015 [Oesophagostomum dentatum]